MSTLDTLSDIAEVTTALIAAIISIYYFCQKQSRRTALQKYLIKERKAAESPGGADAGARSIIHLMASCSMTEAEVLDAAFGNKNIKTWLTADPETGRAEALLFRIDDKAWPTLKNSN